MPGPNKTYEDVDASELIAQYLSSPGASQEFEIGVDVPATTFDGNPIRDGCCRRHRIFTQHGRGYSTFAKLEPDTGNLLLAGTVSDNQTF